MPNCCARVGALGVGARYGNSVYSNRDKHLKEALAHHGLSPVAYGPLHGLLHDRENRWGHRWGQVLWGQLYGDTACLWCCWPSTLAVNPDWQIGPSI